LHSRVAQTSVRVAQSWFLTLRFFLAPQ